jgi:hypothetical protein
MKILLRVTAIKDTLEDGKTLDIEPEVPLIAITTMQ